MSKLDKKIISMVLVLIILISQFSMVFAVDSEKTTLEQYLKDRGVDINSKQDCLDIIQLSLINITDIEKIQKAVNLKTLMITDCDISKIDFTVFTKLENLYIASCEVPEIDFSKLPNLKSLRFSNTEKALNIDFSKLVNLESLDLEFVSLENEFSCDGMINLKSLNLEDVETKELNLSNLLRIKSIYIDDLSNYEKFTLPDCKFLETIMIYNSSDFHIDLSQSENLENVHICMDDLSKLKLPNNETCFYAEKEEFSEQQYTISTISLDNTINMYVGEEIDVYGISNINYTILDEKFAIIDERNNLIKALKIGKTQIELEDTFLNRKYTTNINIVENNCDKSLEENNVTAEILSNAVLKSNGELWKVNSETTAEKVNDDVKKYVYTYLYYGNNDNSDWNYRDYTTLLLSKDNELSIQSTMYNLSSKIEKNISNVKDIMVVSDYGDNKNYYLSNDGNLYDIDINAITGKIITKLVNSNVKKIVNDCIIKNDNTTWLAFHGEFIKMADFEIKDTNDYQIIDMNNTLYDYKINTDLSITVTRKQENFEGFKFANLNDGLNVKLTDEGLAYISTAKQNVNILNHVTSIGNYGGTDILIRKDGTIWLYTQGKGLTKIEKSTVIEEENNHKTEDEIYLKNKNMKSKSLMNRTALIGLKETKQIKDFKAENNFAANFKVEILNIKNELLADEAFIGTGDKIRLYAGDKLVKEYTAIIYGDTDGDGEITAADALAIIMNKTKKNEFKDIAYLEAGRLEASSKEVPSAIDALAIIMYKTGKYTINQSK